MGEFTWFSNFIGNIWVYRILYTLGAIIVALVITTLVNGVIGKAMKSRGGHNLRADTLTKLLKSVVTYVVWFLVIIQILKVAFAVDVASLIAAAGVLGVAIGFGAQTLVKDVISGFFILFENQFAVGERVLIDGFDGVVEELGLRSTKVRGDSGDLLIIPNGSIAKVINLSRAVK